MATTPPSTRHSHPQSEGETGNFALARDGFAHDLHDRVDATGAESDAALGRIQLFPCGTFAARDGRPASMRGVSASAWQCTSTEAETLIAQWQSRATPLVIDYEHQTQNAEDNGKPAPAAGWITQLDWQEGKGLFASVDWTERARAYIRAKEYRYISPVFAFDKSTGAVSALLCAALTNYPALDGLAVVTAKIGLAVVTAKIGMEAVQEKSTGEHSMNKELLAFLQKTLGLPADATEAQCTAAATAALASLPENVLAALVAKDAEITSLKSKTKVAPDPALFVPMDVANTLRQQVTSLSTKITALEGEHAGKTMQADIESALKDGRLPASAKEWATALATSKPEALRDFLNIAPPITALTTQQSSTLPAGNTQVTALTTEDAYVCQQLGMSHEDFTKHKEQK